MKRSNLEISLRVRADLLSGQAEEINRLLGLAFPSRPNFGYEWAAPDRHLTAGPQGGQTGNIGLVEREIQAGSLRIKAGGWRRKGIAGMLVHTAGEALRESCCEQLIPYYAWYGCRRNAAPLFLHHDAVACRSM
jgi:hypothetical protein